MPVDEKINRILAEIGAYAGKLDVEAPEAQLHKVSSALSAVADQLRERIQRKTSGEMKDVIDRLQSGAELSQADADLVRLWMVSDAEFYVQLKQDYPHWLSELDRLIHEIQASQGRELDAEAYGKLSGTIRDALRIVSDMVFFKRQEERVATFETAMTSLTRESKGSLADVLQRKLDSDDF